MCSTEPTTNSTYSEIDRIEQVRLVQRVGVDGYPR